MVHLGKTRWRRGYFWLVWGRGEGGDEAGWRQRCERESSVPSCPLHLKGKGGGIRMGKRKERRPRQRGANISADTMARVGMGGWGWQGAGSQLWLGSISCLLARGVINNHLPSTGSTEASQGAAWCWGRSPAWQPGELYFRTSPATLL